MGKMPIEMPCFHLTEKVPNVLLLGNGICMCAGAKSFSAILDEMKEQYECAHNKEVLEKLAFPMQIVAISGDHVRDACQQLSNLMMQPSYYNPDCPLLRDVLQLSVDAILTTNYSYDLEMAIDPKFLPRRGKYGVFTNGLPKNGAGKYVREPKYQLHSLYRMPFGSGSKDIWHIHGEAANRESMVLGHYYYGNLVSRYKRETERYREKISHNDGVLHPDSWLDYFIFGNVFVVGFSFALAEFDLWWLLNRKKLEYYPHGSVTMIVADEKVISPEMRIMLESYEVKIHSTGDQEYTDYYLHAINYINQVGAGNSV